ncbi:MAG: hypothetical protein R6W88_13765 [Desulfobacterales bacterium]
MNAQLAVAVAVVKSLPLEQQAPVDKIAAELEKSIAEILNQSNYQSET